MAREDWKQPKNKTVWLADLVEAGEAVVKGYEKYLLNRIDYTQLAKLMTSLRNLLPMDIEDKFDK
jgi:hypothetical protein